MKRLDSRFEIKIDQNLTEIEQEGFNLHP